MTTLIRYFVLIGVSALVSHNILPDGLIKSSTIDATASAVALVLTVAGVWAWKWIETLAVKEGIAVPKLQLPIKPNEPLPTTGDVKPSTETK